MIEEHDCVVLTQDIPDASLEAGDMGTVVHVHEGDAGYEVEFMTLAGETLAVVTLRRHRSARSSLAMSRTCAS